MFSTIKNINKAVLSTLENDDKDIALYSTGV
jgi:hypothetical protein